MRPGIVGSTLAAGLCGLAACGSPFLYKPNERMAVAAPAKYKAGISFAAEDAAGCGLLGDNLTSKQLTDVFVQDLGASALFTIVEYDGAGQDDVIVKPALKACALKETQVLRKKKRVPVQTLAVDFQVEARRGEQVLVSKVYHRDWDARLAGSGEKLAAAIQDVMKDVRGDLAASLK